MNAHASSVLSIAIDPKVAESMAEIRYCVGTLCTLAGYSARLDWFAEGSTPDIYYGPRRDVSARVRIPSVPWPFRSAPERSLVGVRAVPELPHLVFAGEMPSEQGDSMGALTHPTDVLFAAYWLLTGAAEPGYPRSRFDDLDLDDSVLVKEGLLARPFVSLLAARWRAHFESQGRPALSWPWESGARRYAFAFSHDVDYPELIRPIEVLRVLARRGVGRDALRLAARVATGASHFWTFAEWIPLAARHGTRPCFYFMARQGSLLQYARGTPDDFYDVRTPRFRHLLRELREQGCEIGLHASYHAHKSAATLRAEVDRIAEASGAPCAGNRHHYWHLDPADPNETLQRHAEAGLRYDSSLGLEYYPGFRRGICHPFRVFHPARRAPLSIVQVPPAWMDDHFDRRLAKNRIADPDAAARALLDAARATRGAVVVDYHSRGMNAEFYPRYGPWLDRFTRDHLDSSVRGMTPSEICDAYLEREATLATDAVDATREAVPPSVETRPSLASPARPR